MLKGEFSLQICGVWAFRLLEKNLRKHNLEWEDRCPWKGNPEWNPNMFSNPSNKVLLPPAPVCVGSKIVPADRSGCFARSTVVVGHMGAVPDYYYYYHYYYWEQSLISVSDPLHFTSSIPKSPLGGFPNSDCTVKLPSPYPSILVDS